LVDQDFRKDILIGLHRGYASPVIGRLFQRAASC
jgi:hypothetical protein